MKPRILLTALFLAMLAVATSLQTAAAASITYGGRATVVDATVLIINTTLVDTGPLPSTGGAIQNTELTAGIPSVLNAGIAHASVIGQSTYTRSEASLSDVDLSLTGLGLQSGILRADAEAKCNKKGKASATGSSTITGLVLNGQPINITGRPNQTISLGLLGEIVINEQIKSVNGKDASITVNALHVKLVDLLGITVADVIIGHAEASISCVKQGGGGGGGGGGCKCAKVGDFVTGSGILNGPKKPDFSLSAGIKNDELYGRLNFNDHNGNKLTNTVITGYEETGAKSRRITGTGKVNGQNVTFTLDVSDNGAGQKDRFRLQLSNGYDSGTLKIVKGCGNIRLHDS